MRDGCNTNKGGRKKGNKGDNKNEIHAQDVFLSDKKLDAPSLSHLFLCVFAFCATPTCLLERTRKGYSAQLMGYLTKSNMHNTVDVNITKTLHWRTPPFCHRKINTFMHEILTWPLSMLMKRIYSTFSLLSHTTATHHCCGNKISSKSNAISSVWIVKFAISFPLMFPYCLDSRSPRKNRAY